MLSNQTEHAVQDGRSKQRHKPSNCLSRIKQRIEAADRLNSAGAEQSNTVAQIADLLHGSAAQDYSPTLCGQFAEEVFELSCAIWVEIQKGFVQKQKGWFFKQDSLQ